MIDVASVLSSHTWIEDWTGINMFLSPIIWIQFLLLNMHTWQVISYHERRSDGQKNYKRCCQSQFTASVVIGVAVS